MLSVYSHTAHRCSYPGCASVLVLDGNMKNYRDVCFAKDAGYIEFEELMGSIKTGCTATPGYKCRYCEQHRNHACDLQYSDGDIDEELDVTAGPALRSNKKSRESGNPVAELILAKKKTRKQIYYQVCFACV